LLVGAVKALLQTEKICTGIISSIRRVVGGKNYYFGPQ
jgi:hypothetical protein